MLRWWLRNEGLRPPPAARLSVALPAFLTARGDSRPLLRWDCGELRRYRGRLYAVSPLPARVGEGPADNGGFIPLGPGLGHFGLIAGHAGGLPAGRSWSIRFRTGGESLRPHSGRPRKRLKDLCQEAGVAFVKTPTLLAEGNRRPFLNPTVSRPPITVLRSEGS